MKNFALLLSLIFCIPAFAQDSDSPLVSFDDYENLMKTVKEHRKTRLVDLDKFNKMSAEDDIYILDTRSKEMYDRKHVKGAIHLNFSDFTQANLDELFPDRFTTILIYCNNNFKDELFFTALTSDQMLRADESFASKVSIPDFSAIDITTIELSAPLPVSTETIQTANQTEIELETEFEEVATTTVTPESPITLALNIPTYINLYGYGYKNVHELSELISIYDSRIQFEGTDVIPVKN